MQFRTGDRVKVMIPPGEQQNAGAVRQFHGKVTVIKSGKHVYDGKCTFGNTYELVGCKSDYGTPYTFPEGWLIPLGEGEE